MLNILYINTFCNTLSHIYVQVSQTAPFKNLKQMLQKKNEQMKDLRKRLAKYEDLDD